MQNSKNHKIEMLQTAISKTLEMGLKNPDHRNQTTRILDKLEGVDKSGMSEETRQLIRDIKSLQSHNEALLDKAVNFLSQFKKDE